VKLETTGPNPEWSRRVALSLKSLKYANGMYVYTGQVKGDFMTLGSTTEPGKNAAQIHLIVASALPVTAEANQMAKSKGFSVAPLPLNLVETLDSKGTAALNEDKRKDATGNFNETGLRGVVLTGKVNPETGSDSGNVNDLNNVHITERLQVVYVNTEQGATLSPFAESAGYPNNGADTPFIDSLAIPLRLVLQNRDATKIIDQVHIFKDDITGATDIVVPNSGYAISVDIIGVGPIWTLTIGVVGKAVNVTDRATNPGAPASTWAAAAGATDPAAGISYIDRIVVAEL
jgi:hypothetical protein